MELRPPESEASGPRSCRNSLGVARTPSRYAVVKKCGRRHTPSTLSTLLLILLHHPSPPRAPPRLRAHDGRRGSARGARHRAGYFILWPRLMRSLCTGPRVSVQASTKSRSDIALPLTPSAHQPIYPSTRPLPLTTDRPVDARVHVASSRGPFPFRWLFLVELSNTQSTAAFNS
jgi:hypothetical protein